MRQTEGAALARDLGSHVDALDAWMRAADALLPAAARPRIQARLRDRVQAILGETPADPGRLAQEVGDLGGAERRRGGAGPARLPPARSSGRSSRRAAPWAGSSTS